VQLICKRLVPEDQTDMIVEFQCCTVRSETPFGILRPSETSLDGWRLSYSSTSPIIYGLRIRDREVIERRPQWRPTDVLCCPTGVTKYWAIHWDGFGWDVHQVPPSAY